MALKEYAFQGGTWLFDTDSVPEGAELIGDVQESVSPGSFEDLVINANPLHKKKRRAAANKQADAPENKSDDEADSE